MTTPGENSLLAEILKSVTEVGKDVAALTLAVARMEERVKTTVDSSIDHEDRIRVIEANYVSKTTARWLVGVGVTVAGIVAALIAAWVSVR